MVLIRTFLDPRFLFVCFAVVVVVAAAAVVVVASTAAVI